MAVGRRSKSLAEFSRKAGLFAEVGLPGANRRAVESAAQFARDAAAFSIAAGSGGDSVLSNVGRSKALRGAGSRAKVGAAYNVKGRENPTALVYATGPLHLLDNPTVPHFVKARGYRISKAKKNRDAVYNAIFGGAISGTVGSARRATPMRTPFGPRYYVQHPGTKGKRTFWRGIDRARPFTPKVFSAEFKNQMRRYWG